MSFIHTTDVIEALRVRLASLPFDLDAPDGEEKLFQRVGVFGSSALEDAMKATFASEQRVCFIVPAGNSHSGDRGRSFLLSSRNTKLVLLIADRAFEREKSEALVGGITNLGILTMSDRVIDNLVSVPFETADLAFEPREGEPLMIQSDKQPGNVGRECWAQTFIAYAGQAKIVIP